MDVRFDKVYWKSKIKNNYGDFFWIRQWNDSAIIIRNSDRGGIKGMMLWTIGSSKPQGITFNWNTEEKSLFCSGCNWIHWKNDSILVADLVIDTKTKIVNSWNPTSVEEELIKKGALWNGERLIYLEKDCKQEDLSCYNEGNICKCPETQEPCKAFVISEIGDTLHVVGHYPYTDRQEYYTTSSFTASNVFDKRCGFELSYKGKFISIRALNLGSNYYAFTLPSALYPSNIPDDYYNIDAMVSIDKNKKELLNPFLWRDGLTFIDSLGNITEY